MAIINAHGTCRHCGNDLTRRRYAAPYSPNEDARKYGVDLWVTGDGQYPGDQSLCDDHVIDDDGSIGRHEPTTA
jgi:hypothetical protein